jgi:hypothetical protein
MFGPRDAMIKALHRDNADKGAEYHRRHEDRDTRPNEHSKDRRRQANRTVCSGQMQIIHAGGPTDAHPQAESKIPRVEISNLDVPGLGGAKIWKLRRILAEPIQRAKAKQQACCESSS